MRYNMKDRITHPYPEDGRLWRALEDLKAKYDRMADMHTPTTDQRESRNIVPAKVYFGNGNWGFIDYKEMYYIREKKQYGFNAPMKARILKFRESMRQQGVPMLIVSRTYTIEEMKVMCKRWLIENGGK
jgi:hypothetical protein